MKGNKFLKKAVCLMLAMLLVIGNASPVVAAHEHETAAEIVTEITNATIKEAEKVIDKTGLLNEADVTDTKNALEKADSNLAGSMGNLGAAVEKAQASIDALDGKVTKDDAKEINASLSAAYSDASKAWADAVATSDAAVADLEKAAEAYAAAKQISDEAAKVAEAEVKASQDALNAAVEAAKFANDNMLNLKNEFAKATELASKWNAEAEEALVEATKNLAEAQAALNAALATLESEDEELRVAIEEFKRCYEEFLEAADAFYASIQTAITAQETLDALYADYEAAQAEYAEVLAAYEAKCAEYEAAGLKGSYEAYKAELKSLKEELGEEDAENDGLNATGLYKALKDAEGDKNDAWDEYQEALNNVDYLAIKGFMDIIATSDDANEIAKATRDTAKYLITKNLLEAGEELVNVGPNGNDTYGIAKDGRDYFVVLANKENGEKMVTNRFGYKLENVDGNSVVNLYEMTETDEVVKYYITYNGTPYAIQAVKGSDNQYYITIDENTTVNFEKIDGKYYKTEIATQKMAANPYDVPAKVNVAGMLKTIVEKEIAPKVGENVSLSVYPNEENGKWYVEVTAYGKTFTREVQVALDLEGKDGAYYVVIFKGLKLEVLGFNLSLEKVVPIEVNKNKDGGYDVQYVSGFKNVEIPAGEKCVNPLHAKRDDHNSVVECDVALHNRYNDHSIAFDVDCVNPDHANDEACKNACQNPYHLESNNHADDRLVGTCSAGHKSKGIYSAHKRDGDVVKALVGMKNYVFPDYQPADCGVTLSGKCSECEPGTVNEMCTGGEFGECDQVPEYCTATALEYPETLKKAVYNGEAYTVLPINPDEDDQLYIDLAEHDENASGIVNLTLNSEGNGYTYKVAYKADKGGTKDTIYTMSKDASEVNSTVYEKVVVDKLDKYEDYEPKYQTALANVGTKKAEIEALIESHVELVEAYNTLQIAKSAAEAKDLGTLVNLPRNIQELLEMSTIDSLEDVTAIVEAIATISKGISFNLKDIISNPSGVLEELTGMSDALAVLAEFLPIAELDFGIDVDRLTDIEYLASNGGELVEDFYNSDMGQALTNTESYKYTYMQAWLDALTTKVAVIESALELVEVSTTAIEAGVTAVTEGIELADVAVDAVVATAEKAMLEATVDVLAMTTEVLGTSEEVITTIDNIIAAAQARTEAAYAEAVAERDAVSQITVSAPYEEKLAAVKAIIDETEVAYNTLVAEVVAADATLVAAKELSNELTGLAEHKHNYNKAVTEATCTEDGVIVYTCAICPDTYTEILTAPGHKGVAGASQDVHTKCETCGEVLSKEHNLTSTVTKEPTCTEVGTMLYTCECGYSYEEDIKENGHSEVNGGEADVHTKCSVCNEVISAAHGEFTSEVTTAPGCVTTGVETFTCSCGYSYTKTIPSTGHKVVSGGTADVHEKCSVCGTKADTVHNYKPSVTKESTCTETGVMTYTCACGHSYTENIELKPHTPAGDEEEHLVCKDCEKEIAEGHSFTSSVTKEATCTESGVRTYTCECGYSYTETIPATGHGEAVNGGKADVHTKCSVCGDALSVAHSYTESVVKEATCAEKGELKHTCSCGYSYTTVIEKTNHHNPVAGNDKDVHQKCATCGTVLVKEHSYGSAVTKQPTCTEVGERTYTCGCGYSYTEEIDALGHTAPVNGGIEAAHTKCEKCDHVFDAVHNYASKVTVDPTCTEVGEKTYTCECGYSYKEEVVATGHTATNGGTVTAHEKCATCGVALNADHSFTSEVVIAPTCEKVGLEKFTCECGYTYTKELSETGHSYAEEFTVDTEATCTEEGSKSRHCTVEGCDAKTDVTTIEALGHTYDAVVTAPTCVAGGYTTYTCSVCSDKYVADAVAATGHSYIARVIDPTCTAGGYTTYTCACGSYVVGDRTAALNHAWSDWTVTTEATETTTGVATRECATCHATQTVELDMLEASPVVDIEDEETPLADGKDEVVIEDEETPLAGGEDEVVIEDEETPLANGEEIVIEEEDVPLAAGNGGNVGIAVAAVGGIAVVGTGAAVAANQAGLFGAGAAATSAATSAASAGTAGAGSKGFLATVAAFFKKLFRK